MYVADFLVLLCTDSIGLEGSVEVQFLLDYLSWLCLGVFYGAPFDTMVAGDGFSVIRVWHMGWVFGCSLEHPHGVRSGCRTG